MHQAHRVAAVALPDRCLSGRRFAFGRRFLRLAAGHFFELRFRQRAINAVDGKAVRGLKGFDRRDGFVATVAVRAVAGKRCPCFDQLFLHFADVVAAVALADRADAVRRRRYAGHDAGCTRRRRRLLDFLRRVFHIRTKSPVGEAARGNLVPLHAIREAASLDDIPAADIHGDMTARFRPQKQAGDFRQGCDLAFDRRRAVHAGRAFVGQTVAPVLDDAAFFPIIAFNQADAVRRDLALLDVLSIGCLSAFAVLVGILPRFPGKKFFGAGVAVRPPPIHVLSRRVNILRPLGKPCARLSHQYHRPRQGFRCRLHRRIRIPLRRVGERQRRLRSRR